LKNPNRFIVYENSLILCIAEHCSFQVPQSEKQSFCLWRVFRKLSKSITTENWWWQRI